MTVGMRPAAAAALHRATIAAAGATRREQAHVGGPGRLARR